MNRYLLDKFYDLNFNIYFDGIENLGWAKVYTSKLILEEYNNHADIYSLDSNIGGKLEQVETILLNKKRKPAVYISDFTIPKAAPDALKNFGYTKLFEDVWMVLEEPYVLTDRKEYKEILYIGNNPKLIKALEEISILAYSGEKSVDNPYGGIPMSGYLNAAKRALLDHSFNEKIEGYLLQHKGQFVSCALLLHDRDVGYVANVATIPEFRGMGFGKTISNYAGKRSKQLGLRRIFLGTEKGSKNEDFYSHLGYKTQFTGTCYIKTGG